MSGHNCISAKSCPSVDGPRVARSSRQALTVFRRGEVGSTEGLRSSPTHHLQAPLEQEPPKTLPCWHLLPEPAHRAQGQLTELSPSPGRLPRWAWWLPCVWNKEQVSGGQERPPCNMLGRESTACSVCTLPDCLPSLLFLSGTHAEISLHQAHVSSSPAWACGPGMGGHMKHRRIQFLLR